MERGKVIDGNTVDKENGHTAYITRRERDNGLDGFIDYDDKSYMNKKFPVITIGNETAQPFVHSYPFYTGTNINILSPRSHASKYALMFIAECFRMQKIKYSYAYAASATRLNNQIIKLPINESGQPDYLFMEKFIRSHERKLIREYLQVISAKINNHPLSQRELLDLDNKQYGKFVIGDLFTLIPGKSKGANHLVKASKGISYLGATNRNNAVLDFVSTDKNLIQEGNCIAFIRNGEGSIGYSVYKQEDFISTSDITVGYAPFLDRYTGIFITTVADKVRGKYNFNYKRSASRLKKEMIQLPIDDNGQPDYLFMKNFIQAHEYNLIQEYLHYISIKYQNMLS